MSQHFLLSAAARTLSLAKVLRLSDEEAFDTFKKIRWAANDGQPVCPRCGSVEVYTYTARRIFKCKGCHAQFSITTATIFASRKLSLRDILAAIAIFTNGAKGISALQLSRDLDVQAKTAFVMLHKLREAMAADSKDRKLSGTVEIDGGYFGGYVKPKNHAEHRLDRRLKSNRSGKRQVVVVMRQRAGRTLPFVFGGEDESIPTIRARVTSGSTIYADEASVWDTLHGHANTGRINHSIAFSDEGVCTNQAESYFSRLRRMEIGTHHHVAGPYLGSYASEAAWREDHRRQANGEQFKLIVSAALMHPVSRMWKGYWQRRAATHQGPASKSASA